MEVCRVCSEVPPKYRCPACKIRYCSLGCYKKHKDGCVPVKVTGTDPGVSLSHCGLNGTPDGEGCWSVEDLLDEDDESDRVSFQKLKLLGESQDLRSLLRNPHLQQLLLTVDQAESKEGTMKRVMQEPLFVEFADRCLKIVEPTEKENISPVE
nr:PREDICTED: zinc finger HIT domain-containing protein 3 [Lepisosteus oculatus]